MVKEIYESPVMEITDVLFTDIIMSEVATSALDPYAVEEADSTYNDNLDVAPF